MQCLLFTTSNFRLRIPQEALTGYLDLGEKEKEMMRSSSKLTMAHFNECILFVDFDQFKRPKGEKKTTWSTKLLITHLEEEIARKYSIAAFHLRETGKEKIVNIEDDSPPRQNWFEEFDCANRSKRERKNRIVVNIDDHSLHCRHSSRRFRRLIQSKRNWEREDIVMVNAVMTYFNERIHRRSKSFTPLKIISSCPSLFFVS